MQMGTPHPTLQLENCIHILSMAVQLYISPASAQAHPLWPGLSLRWGQSQLTATPAFYLSVITHSPVCSHTPDLPALSETLVPPHQWLLFASTLSCHKCILKIFPHQLLCPTVSPQGHSYHLSTAEKYFTLPSHRAAHCSAPTQVGLLPSPSPNIAAFQRQLYSFL